jgi:hypothetical protein
MTVCWPSLSQPVDGGLSGDSDANPVAHRVCDASVKMGAAPNRWIRFDLRVRQSLAAAEQDAPGAPACRVPLPEVRSSR